MRNCREELKHKLSIKMDGIDGNSAEWNVKMIKLVLQNFTQVISSS